MTTFITGTVYSQVVAAAGETTLITPPAFVDGSAYSAVEVEENAHLLIAGVVSAQTDAVEALAEGARIDVLSTGLVEAGSVGLIVGPGEAHIAGQVHGRDSGLYFNDEGGFAVIASTGVVTGGRRLDDATPTNAAVLARSGGELINDGTLIGEEQDVTGQRIALGNARHDYVTGSWSDDDAFEFSLTNSGVIIGDLLFFNGFDVYDARGDGYVIGRIDMGDGADRADGGRADEVFLMGAGADVAYGRGGDDEILGGGEDDRLYGGSGDDDLDGQAGEDLLAGGGGEDLLYGGGQADLLRGGADDDRLWGGGGDDVLRGGAGDDVLLGQKGHDTMVGGAGDDRLTGGKGDDVFLFAGRFGSDVVSDFSKRNAEKLDLSALGSISSFADLRNNHLTQDGDDLVIDAGPAGEIRLLNFLFSDLGAADVIL